MTTPVNSWLDQYALPICSDKESPHSYKQPTEMMPNFKVRSEFYVTRGHPRKGKKEPSAPPGCNLVGLFLVPAETKIPHICAHALNNKAAGFRVAIVFAVSRLSADSPSHPQPNHHHRRRRRRRRRHHRYRLSIPGLCKDRQDSILGLCWLRKSPGGNGVGVGAGSSTRGVVWG